LEQQFQLAHQLGLIEAADVIDAIAASLERSGALDGRERGRWRLS